MTTFQYFSLVMSMLCIVGRQAPLAAAQTSAEDVLLHMEELQRRSKDETARIEMRLFDGEREIRRREFILRSSIDSARRTRLLIEFTNPPDIRGLRLLTIETSDGDDQRIYLPALRRVQRIAGSAREERFAGSDFSYEDLRVRDRTRYESKIVGSSDSLWIIESAPKDLDSPYRRIVLEIDKEMYAVVGARYFDRKDRLRKVLSASGFVKTGDNVWRASRITMEDVRANRRTELLYLERDLQTTISPDVFTDRYLRRGVQ